jgi:hypothetical protein
MPGPLSKPIGGKTAHVDRMGKQSSSEHNPAYKRLQIRIKSYEQDGVGSNKTRFHKPGSLSGRK